MELVKTSLKGLWIVRPDVFADFRGENFMVWHQEQYALFCDNAQFIEHNIFKAKRNVLNGIHHSPNCWKLYECLYGNAYYVFVNCEATDSNFGQWHSILLTGENHYQIIKPPCYGTGFVALSDYTIIHILQSEYYNKDNPNQFTYRYDDPRFNIWWPTDKPILSKRDKKGEYEFRLKK